MMNAQEILALYDLEQRVQVEYPGLRREAAGRVVRFVGQPRPHDNYVLYSRLSEADADRTIREQIDYFETLGHPFEWKVYDHDTPSDLRERLAAHGFRVREPADAIMALDLTTLPDSLDQPPVADIRRLSDPDQLEDVLEILNLVWPGENHGWLVETMSADMTERSDYLSVYVAYVGSRPASTGWINFHPNSQFASLWGGSTVAEFRKKGLYRDVLASRLHEARRRGYRFATIDASPMNQPIAAHYGFQLLTMAYACLWPPNE